MASSEPELIQYVPFKSFVNPSFWHALTEKKIDVDKLDDERKIIYGRYTNKTTVRNTFEVDSTSFNEVPEQSNWYINVTGILINRNTIEDFKSLDKPLLLNTLGDLLWDSVILTKRWITDPSALNTFGIISFADLKKFNYYYWFMFPAPNQPIIHLSKKTTDITEHFSDKAIDLLLEGYNALSPTDKAFFLVSKENCELCVKPLSSVFEKVVTRVKLNRALTYFAFTDPSNDKNPGWPLRNFLAAMFNYCPFWANAEIKVIGLRCDVHGCIEDSPVYTLKLPQQPLERNDVKWLGWERNGPGNFGPRLAKMAASMDPVKLADTSSDLNVKLMKWRLVPELNIEVMKNTKCLLLGAGTLGCHVARNLLAWGFRKITFVDNGKVSFSNPTRQVLFNHEDCLNGGKKKAEAAAESLKNILPSVDSKGIAVHIPMPGHPIGEALYAETVANIETITKAIADHDVVFLLLDTREARWLPTLIASHYGKIVINAALGFDSYLVMRHGISTEVTPDTTVDAEFISGEQLGCYFCNDVTAPGNSTKDRTLDQQCTVTRPGGAAIAGALAVELLVGLLQHPLGINAPALYNMYEDSKPPPGLQGILGPVPHSIRGFMHNFQNALPTSAKFKQCIACSEPVVKLYREEGTKFLMDVFNSGTYLEEVTGLAELNKAAEMIDILTFPNFDDEDEEKEEQQKEEEEKVKDEKEEDKVEVEKGEDKVKDEEEEDKVKVEEGGDKVKVEEGEDKVKDEEEDDKSKGEKEEDKVKIEEGEHKVKDEEENDKSKENKVKEEKEEEKKE